MYTVTHLFSNSGAQPSEGKRDAMREGANMTRRSRCIHAVFIANGLTYNEGGARNSFFPSRGLSKVNEKHCCDLSAFCNIGIMIGVIDSIACLLENISCKILDSLYQHFDVNPKLVWQ